MNDAKKWFERSDKDSNFKIKLELISEENGYLFFSNHFDEKMADVVMDDGDQKDIWLDILKDFEETLDVKGWRLMELETK